MEIYPVASIKENPQLYLGKDNPTAADVEPVEVQFLWRPQLGDPDDEMVLEAAINGQADRLVTFIETDFAAATVWHPHRQPGALLEGDKAMSKATFSLKLPLSIKRAAERLAKQDGVSLNQWIASAVAQKVGVMETAQHFFTARASGGKAKNLRAVLAKVPDKAPDPRDRR